MYKDPGECFKEKYCQVLSSGRKLNDSYPVGGEISALTPQQHSWAVIEKIIIRLHYRHGTLIMV